MKSACPVTRSLCRRCRWEVAGGGGGGGDGGLPGECGCCREKHDSHRRFNIFGFAACCGQRPDHEQEQGDDLFSVAGCWPQTPAAGPEVQPWPDPC